MLKMMKKGVEDKSSDVRLACATMGSSLAPLSIVPGTAKNPSMLHHLDDIMNHALTNLDDESAAVGNAWASAIGVCANACIAVQKLHDAEATVVAAKREVEDEEEGAAQGKDKKKVRKRERERERDLRRG